MSINKSQFITVAEMAKMLGVTRAAINKQISEKKIPAEKVGRNYLIPKTALPADLRERIRKGQKEATKNVIEKSHHHDLDFEKELWAAADKLRGNIDVSEYKNIVLGLLFLKYISDAFYKRREELEVLTRDQKNEDFYVADDKARAQILETKDFYKSVGVFYVPEKSRWEHLQTKTMQSDIGQVLDKAMEYIEEDNRAELEGVLPKVYTRTTLDSSVLGELVNIFSRISFNHDFDREKDILGRIYEYFLGQFASAEGRRGGEFFTPRSIVKLLVEILEPYENARVLDPACGSGGMFVAMGEYLRDHKQDPSKLAINGQESNQTTLRLAKMNLAIRGLSGKIELGNTYYQDKFPHLQADFVIANPPFNAEWEPSKLTDNDPRITLGTPPSSNANFMWVQHFAHHLAPNGYAGFVMPNGALAAGGKEGELRKKLIQEDLVDIIIACPPKLFYNVPLSVSLWFLAKNKSSDRFRNRGKEILFVDAQEVFEVINKKHVRFSGENIQRISRAVHAWRNKNSSEYKDIPGFCKSINVDAVEQGNYVLTPARYVDLKEIATKRPRFDLEMRRIHSFFKKQTEIRKKIDTKISDALRKYFPENDWSRIDFSSSEMINHLSETLFEEWFDPKKIKEKSKIVDLPEVAKVVDCLHVKVPKKQDAGKPLLQVFNIGHDGLLDLSETYNISEEDYNIWSKNIEVREGDIVITNAGRVGAIAQIPRGFKTAIGRNMTALRATGVSPTYLLHYLFSSYGRQQISVNTDSSTIFASLNVRGIKKMKILIPPKDLLEKYEEVAALLQEKKEIIQMEKFENSKTI
ncbi:MAG TPA: N-6 DNA methylase [Candidatus Wunengus sp. YC60]|uniref:N-6 DNA methylase n=1 Tax=Candidatus Wunengus sp. YC60 TaxID=3367697 RepID=UPI0040259AF3